MNPDRHSPIHPLSQRRTASNNRLSSAHTIALPSHQTEPFAAPPRSVMQSARVSTAVQICKQRPYTIGAVLSTLLISTLFIIYITLIYTPAYTPRVVGDVYFDPPVCIQHVNNITTAYNDAHNILSMRDLQSGLHHTSPSKLTHAQTGHQPLAHYAVGDDNTEERRRWNQRKYKFHVLWEDPVRKCPCHTCMHKLAVLVRSFLATQDLEQSAMIIWASEPEQLIQSVVLAPALPWVVVKKYDPYELAKGTFLENSALLSTTDDRVYLQGDLFRWLVLHVYGGVYVDADSILLNDFQPLLEKGDFWARWACTDYMSPGIMSLQQNGKVTTEILHKLIETDPAGGSYVWGRGTMTPWYDDKIARQRAGTLTADEAQIPFVCPACYFYPQWCTEEFHAYFDAPESEAAPAQLFLGGFAYHWHGGGGSRFERSYEKNSQFDLTEKFVSKLLEIKYGVKTPDEMLVIDKAMKKATTSTGLIVHTPAQLQHWDTEHWYTTAFNQYAPPNTCNAATMIKVEHILVYILVAVAVFSIVTQVFVKGGVKQAISASINMSVQLLKAIYRLVTSLIDMFGGLLYMCVQFVLHRRNANTYQQLPTQSRSTSTGWMQRFTDPAYKTSTQRMLVAVVAAIATIITLSIIRSLKSHDCGFGGGGEYSIGIYTGSTAFTVNEREAAQQHHIHNPVITRRHIDDRPAKFVADPFLVAPTGRVGESSHWYLFFEVQSQPTASEDGDIGVATSTDAVSWQYQGIVLDEPFHLSYPYVFNYESTWYMLPETGRRGQVRLYQSTAFPYSWTLSSVLIDDTRQWLDPSIFQWHGRWYMFVTIAGDASLYLYHSSALHTGWTEHVKSPVVRNDNSQVRPAGRVLVVDDEFDEGHQRVYRFAQNNEHEYGQSVNAHEITELSPTQYSEKVMEPTPLLQGSRYGPTELEMKWNDNNMHHIDAHVLPDGKYMASVDGCGIVE